MSTIPSATPPKALGPATGSRTESLVRRAFDDVALVFGGAATLHKLEDDAVWTVMRRLDRIRVRLLRDLKGLSQRNAFEGDSPEPPRVHAAVEEFLSRNRVGASE